MERDTLSILNHIRGKGVDMERLSIDEAISNFKLFHKEDLEKLTYEEDFLKRSGYTKERLNVSAERNSQLVEWLEELKAYREAEEQGLLWRLPCKVGDTIYKLGYKPCHHG